MSDGSERIPIRFYRPGSGTEGMAFQEAYCDRCVKDRGFPDDDKEDGARQDLRFSKAKPIHRLSAWTDRHCIALVYALYPFMGERRKAKIEEMAVVWQRPRRGRVKKPTRPAQARAVSLGCQTLLEPAAQV